MPENLSSGFTNNKGADQPAYPCRLFSAFVFSLLESIISRLAKFQFSSQYLAEKTDLRQVFSP